MNQNAEKNDGVKPEKKASTQKAGGVIQQVGLNMVMIGMVRLTGLPGLAAVHW